MNNPEKYWSRISMRVSVRSTDAEHDALDRILPGIAKGVADKLGIKCKDVEIEHWLIIHNLEPDDMSMKLKRKLIGLWRSRTAWAGALLGFLVAIQPALIAWLNYKLAPSDYALAGLVITGAVWALRWITERPLEEKGKQ